MPYLDRVIQPGENVLYQTCIHWVIFVPGVFLTIAGFLWLAFALTQSNTILDTGGFIATAIVIGLIAIISSWIKRTTTEIAITDRRVIYKTGLIRRHTIEMNMNKVESVDVNQSIPGRLLDYGTIVVHGTGSGIEPLRKIEAPLKFRAFVTGH